MTSTAHATSRTLRWHGWRIDLPDGCDPAKLDGNADAGEILLADLERPRLGLRWRRLKKKDDIAKSIERALIDEVGSLAAGESFAANPPGGDWVNGRAYLDPEPPGRDVWIGYNRSTGRLFEIIYHAKRRDRELIDTLLPKFVDGIDDEWAIFDLHCRVPGGAKLEKHRLNVGDLSLEFSLGREPLVARQLAVASVALARQSIGRWLAAQQSARKQFYRTTEQPQAIEWTIAGRPMTGVRRELVRRRRFFFQRRKPKSLVGVALHDASRDKLLIAEAIDEPAVRALLESMGWPTG